MIRKPLFSKTGYQKGVQCLKALYLYKYHSKLRDPLPEERRIRFETGHQIGTLAQALFPGGMNLRPGTASQPVADAQKTREAITSGRTVLYEPAFIYNQVIVYNDVLVKSDDGWHLFEVKSNIHIPDHYKEDLAVQAYVVRGSGQQLRSASIIHLKIPLSEIKADQPLQEIFDITDLTEECLERQAGIEKNIAEMQLTLALRRVPDIPTGAHCQTPYPCEFTGHCHGKAPELNEGVFSLFT